MFLAAQSTLLVVRTWARALEVVNVVGRLHLGQELSSELGQLGEEQPWTQRQQQQQQGWRDA